MFAYSIADVPALLSNKGATFFNKVEKSLLDKFVMREHFNTLNATRIQWALAK
jgi:hypothetical protein